MTASDAIVGTIIQDDLVAPLPIMVALNEFVEEYVPDHPVAINKVLEAYNNLLEYIPHGYLISREELQRGADAGYKPPTMSVPLYDILTKPGEAILDFVGPFFHKATREAGLFEALRKQLMDNENAASGISNVDRVLGRKDVVGVDEYKAETPELIRLYLRHTPFYELFHTQINFRIKRERFNEHGALFARSGHGKTRALRAMVAQFLNDPDPPALFLMNSLGSLIEDIADLEIFTTTLKDRLVILDPSDPNYLPRLNFFNVKSDDLCFYLFKAIDQSFTQRQATMISYLMEYMRLIPEPSILKLVRVCESKNNTYPEVMDRLSPFARSFFENQFFAGKGGDVLVQQTKSQIAQRLYTLGRLPKFDAMFSAPDDLFDPYECMQRKRVVLINTDARSTDQGGLGEASGIFGRYILAQCLSAARRRPKHERHLALLVVDECKAYMDEQAALILSDARQFGLGMLLASQFPHQLEEGVRREINTNTSIRMMGAIEYSVAAQYARDMFCEPEFITSMKSYDKSHAEWAVYTTDMAQAAKVTMPFRAIENMPKASRSVRALNFRAPETRTAATLTPRTRDHFYEGERDEILGCIARAEAKGDLLSSTDNEEKANGTGGPEPLIKPGKSWD